MTARDRKSKNMRWETVREESIRSQTERKITHSRRSFNSTPPNAPEKPSDRRLPPYEHVWYNETATAVSTKYSLMRRIKSEQNMSLADRNNPVGRRSEAAETKLHTKTQFVRIKPPGLPALFVVRLGIEPPTWNTRLVDSAHEDILRISMPHMRSDDILTELLSTCLKRIAIHSPKWQILSRDERTAFSIEEQSEWLKDCLINASTSDNPTYFCFEMWKQHSETDSERFQSVNQLLQNLFNQVNILTFNVPFCTVQMLLKTVGVCLLLLLQTMKNRLDKILCTEMADAHPDCGTSYRAYVTVIDSPESPSRTRSHWSPKLPRQCDTGSLIVCKGDLLPAEIVSVNLPCTPTMVITHDFDAKFPSIPLTESISSFDFTSEFWESSPVVHSAVPILAVSRQNLSDQEWLKRSRSSSLLISHQTLNDANADGLFDPLSGSATYRQKMVGEDRSAIYQKHEQLKHSCKNPWRHSAPEGLDRPQYFCLKLSLPAFPVYAEGNSLFQHSESCYRQHRPEGQKSIIVLDSSTMPQGDHLPSREVREQLGMQIIFIIIKAILAKTPNSMIQNSDCFLRSVSDPTISDQVQTFIDQAIAFTVTHTMITNLRGLPKELCQLVNSVPINVSLVIEKLLLQSLLAEDLLEPKKKSHELNLPGEYRINRSAKELVQRVSEVINVVLDEATSETEIGKNLARHVLRLAFPAVRVFVEQLLVQSDTRPLWNSRKRFSSQPELLYYQTALQEQQPLTWSTAVSSTIPLTHAIKPSRSSAELVASDLDSNRPAVWQSAEPAGIGYVCGKQTDRYSTSLTVKCRADIPSNLKQECLDQQESEQSNVATNLTRLLLDEKERNCLPLSGTNVENLSPQPLTNNEPSSPENVAGPYLSALSSRSEYVTDLENEYTSTASSSYTESVGRPEVEPRDMIEKASNISVQVLFDSPLGADQSICEMKVSSGQNELINPTLRGCGIADGNTVALCQNCSEQLLLCIKQNDCGSQLGYIPNNLFSQSMVDHSNTNISGRVESRQSRMSFMDQRPSTQNSVNTTHITDDPKKVDPPTRSNCVSAIRLDSDEEIPCEAGVRLIDENEVKVTLNHGANEQQITGSTPRQASCLPTDNQTSFVFNQRDAKMKQVSSCAADKANQKTNGNMREGTETRTNPSEWLGSARRKKAKSQHFIPSNISKVSNAQSNGDGLRIEVQYKKAPTCNKTAKYSLYTSDQRGGGKRQPIQKANPLGCDTGKENQRSSTPVCLDEASYTDSKPCTQANPHHSMDPFYSCLEELKDCLMRAESRLSKFLAIVC
ncbi:hypothetical protein P879_03236 [Paragonimus westermani]|uniref:Uncharacterized protein n=1 Tax=Paragonimus westermani TaxID=34504 RepID=A0A8T0DLQ8_9TREM|nr:hypothetical protein P879_03236 [Paragonimus westermani]